MRALKSDQLIAACIHGNVLPKSNTGSATPMIQCLLSHIVNIDSTIHGIRYDFRGQNLLPLIWRLYNDIE